MYRILDNLVKDKNVLILGFGREGKSTLKALEKVKSYRSISIADINNVDSDGYKLYSGENYQDNLDDFDVVFKSPGIVLNKKFKDYKCYITSQMDVFLEKYKEQCIGITGSKGKSTTSSLTKHMFEKAGRDVLLAGNIGIPVFDLVDDIYEDTIIVLEISCHQLEYCRFNPHVSVLLNIYQEHLDHYGTFDKYKTAKENIYKFHTRKDYLVVNIDNCPSRFKYHGHLNVIGLTKMPYDSMDGFDSKLIGMHNYFNCMAVREIAKIYGISELDYVKAINSFIPLEHRLEFVDKKNGVDYYNDSISTIVESCINAIKSIKNIETILIGGMDRGIDYTELIDYLKLGHCKNVVLMYDSGKRIYESLKNASNINVVYFDDLAKSFVWAKEHTDIGKAVVLSPASASYGFFKNFEERGRAFKQMVDLL